MPFRIFAIAFVLLAVISTGCSPQVAAQIPVPDGALSAPAADEPSDPLELPPADEAPEELLEDLPDVIPGEALEEDPHQLELPPADEAPREPDLPDIDTVDGDPLELEPARDLVNLFPPDERPQTAIELRDELEQYLESVGDKSTVAQAAKINTIRTSQIGFKDLTNPTIIR